MTTNTSVQTAKTKKAAALPAEGYCSIRALAQPNGVTPWAESTIWLLVRQRRFPQPERFGLRCTRWRVEQIREYLADPKAWEASYAPNLSSYDENSRKQKRARRTS
ncbi:AlpA family phage regulatory protein [Bordetella tumulicola]